MRYATRDSPPVRHLQAVGTTSVTEFPINPVDTLTF